MQTIGAKRIDQVVISCIFILALMTMTYVTGMTAVNAKDKENSPGIQADALINSAKNDIEAGKWKDVVENFDKAVDLGINLPGEFIFFMVKHF